MEAGHVSENALLFITEPQDHLLMNHLVYDNENCFGELTARTPLLAAR